jgi:hypothetical protein
VLKVLQHSDLPNDNNHKAMNYPNVTTHFENELTWLLAEPSEGIFILEKFYHDPLRMLSIELFFSVHNELSLITSLGRLDMIRVEFLDLSGELIHSRTILSDSTLNCEFLTAGIYFVNIYIGNKGVLDAIFKILVTKF